MSDIVDILTESDLSGLGVYLPGVDNRKVIQPGWLGTFLPHTRTVGIDPIFCTCTAHHLIEISWIGTKIHITSETSCNQTRKTDRLSRCGKD